MDTKHTPGPWRLGGQMTLDNAQHPTVIRGSEGHMVARIAKNAAHAYDDDLTAQANARLIAAAPDLLVALQDVEQKFDRDPSSLTAAQSKALANARAAIAKAVQS